MSKATQFIKNISNQENEFSLNEPRRLNEDSLNVIVPVLRQTKKERGYITLPEAEDVKVEDTGQIDFVYVKNNEDKPLYISRGEFFRGKTQERVAVHGYIINPNEGKRVAVRCIHQSRGINSGTKMSYGGKVPYNINLSNQSATWNSIRDYTGNSDYSGTYRTGSLNGNLSFINGNMNNFTLNGQNTYIRSDIGNTGTYTSTNQDIDIPSSDDLSSTLDSISDSIKEMMKKIPHIDNQIGAIFLKENHIHGLDVYNLKESWKAIKDDVIEKEGSEFLDKEEACNIFEFKPEKINALIKKKLDVEFDEKTIYDKKYKVVEIKSDKLVGEAVEYNNEIIHLTLARKNEK